MDINKAIRKQKKSYNRFMLMMCFIFFTLPIILYLSGISNMFYVIYLAGVEILILAAILSRVNGELLTYQCDGSKVKIKSGLFSGNISLGCDRVVIVHAEGKAEDVELIIITNSKFRNKRIRPIDNSFMKKYGYAAHEYTRIKKLYPENSYYYIIIKKGGFIKHKLLSEMYKSCVAALYTEDAIECIKLWQSR